MTDATSGAETAYPSRTHEPTPVFSGVRIAKFLAFCVDRCLSFVDLRILITPLVFSNSSCMNGFTPIRC